jgi:hypothetical protein
MSQIKLYDRIFSQLAVLVINYLQRKTFKIAKVAKEVKVNNLLML